ncbi:hypothetical protein GN958_ATG19330 [Phytophthora infestans]|uniref:Uncharacterized protein n=1 Tax=Phytophthora infestans TaxID=4787 RepID=A0A8S9TR61_PHYIN|nr:hypothetical protein GN958_ATG19330 [Phytophthora infestans]
MVLECGDELQATFHQECTCWAMRATRSGGICLLHLLKEKLYKIVGDGCTITCTQRLASLSSVLLVV